jgi:KUP system potassium uptake protein
MRIDDSTRFWRKIPLQAFLWLRDNTRSKVESMNIPVEQLLQVGFIKELH